MRNIKLTIEYDGAAYAGWQVQHNSPRTIQGIIEKVLGRILQEKVRLIGSGRTDAGVHAKAQVANFKTLSYCSLEKLQKSLNGLLPDDIVVTRIAGKPLLFHSRFSAKAKHYRYTILNRPFPSAFARTTAYFYPYSLELKPMRKAAAVLVGRHNFRSFQAADKKERDSVRTISQLEVKRVKDLIYIDIEADGFLYTMVRVIVGTLIEIGRGRLPVARMKEILNARDRKRAGPTAPACGLCLVKVYY
ncbi:MAG: tRNA pseudouridine(38-40) synthase TruA [Candidatus Omnitrophica bacterium]|nr:tRNA pseudouridine(38-40) synthase TruA [Candidatus Omnitrophota bacterium]